MKLDGVFILAAGLGTRLRPLTLIRPKPCVPVLGASPLKRWLDRIESLDPAKVVLNTHHLPELVQTEWERHAPGRLRFCYSHEPEILDTGGGLREAAKKIPGNDAILVLNGDVMADPPIHRLLDLHASREALCTAWVHPRQEPKTVVWDDGGGVRTFRDRENGRAVFCGVYVIGRRILDHIPAEGPYPIIDALESAIREGHKVQVLPDEASWCDIGSVDRYWKLHSDGALRKTWLSPGGADLRAGCLAEGSGCRIDPSARLKNVLLWDNVTVDAGSNLENVILTDGVSVHGEHRNRILSNHGIHPLIG